MGRQGRKAWFALVLPVAFVLPFTWSAASAAPVLPGTDVRYDDPTNTFVIDDTRCDGRSAALTVVIGGHPTRFPVGDDCGTVQRLRISAEEDLPCLAHTPASASSSASSPDRGANAQFQSDGDRLGLDDVKCDNHSVYIDYYLSGHKRTFSNTQGCNTTALWLNLGVPEGQNISWRVCTKYQIGADSCTAYISDQA